MQKARARWRTVIHLTNFGTWRTCASIARRRRASCSAHQLQYSLLDDCPSRARHGRVLPRAPASHLFCYGTIAGGFLSNQAGWASRIRRSRYANRSLVKYRLMVEEFGGWDRFQELLRQLDAIARKHHTGISTIAARWVLDKPQVALALVGAKDAKHLAETLEIFRVKLDDDDRKVLGELAASSAGAPGDCYAVERDPASIHKRIMQMNQNVHGAPVNMLMAPNLNELRGQT
jgi:aryl-alcohol dehydrogenase-like predicted oxidoreductase